MRVDGTLNLIETHEHARLLIAVFSGTWFRRYRRTEMELGRRVSFPRGFEVAARHEPRSAFSGEVTFRKARPNGAIIHAEMRIGDSMLMVADSTAQFAPTTSSIYLYVTDCDVVYQSALRAGGVSVFPIMTLPSGERYGGVKDPCGNIWWIATHVEDVPPEEEEKRWKQFKMP